MQAKPQQTNHLLYLLNGPGGLSSLFVRERQNSSIVDDLRLIGFTRSPNIRTLDESSSTPPQKYFPVWRFF